MWSSSAFIVWSATLAERCLFTHRTLFTTNFDFHSSKRIYYCVDLFLKFTMAASVETQRLITMSLGKIAQSRSQRGGLNLHKNLLVATVLHKARTAYMMETYNYQQQQHQLSLQNQKYQQEQLLQQQQQQHQLELQRQQQQAAVSISNNDAAIEADMSCVEEEECQVSHLEVEVGQCSEASQSSASQEGSTESSQIFVPSASSSPAPQLLASEGNSVHQSLSCCQMAADKENTIPSVVSVPEPIETTTVITTPFIDTVPPVVPDHMEAANKLSQEASMCALSSCAVQANLCQQNQNTTSGSPTCHGVLKRRRDNSNHCNINQSSEFGCPLSKKARVIHESSLSSSSCLEFVSFAAEMRDFSSDESDSESDLDSEVISSIPMLTPDSPQISNLVTIFNSGLSNLCTEEELKNCQNSSDQDYHHEPEFEISSPPQYTTLTQLKPESSQNSNSNFSHTELLCSTEVGRMDSLQSAIVLSA